ncbi:MAG: hypothetical protein PUD22_09650 [Erysipelotrichaceae bacterium]|nr:hypothetical protein [Erysipelotrichaceae bacterium]
MEVTSDIILRGTAWDSAIKGLSGIFSTRPHYQIYMLSLAIGIMYDKRIENPEENGEDPKSVPRNVIINNDKGKLDFYFQAAILSTKTEDLDEETRLDLAFGDKTDFPKLSTLNQFANYGVTVLAGLVGDTELESISKIRDFMSSSIEGNNFDIDDLDLDNFSDIDL